MVPFFSCSFREVKRPGHQDQDLLGPSVNQIKKRPVGGCRYVYYNLYIYRYMYIHIKISIKICTHLFWGVYSLWKVSGPGIFS